MTLLAARLDQYLTVRRSLGYSLSFSERVLRRFVAFADGLGADHLTVELFLRWKKHYGAANNGTWSTRLGMLRGFAAWLQGLDPHTEVPPLGLIPGKPRRSRPYIYSDEQIARIVDAAAGLPSSYGLRGWTFATLFGLIAVSGLRVSEALGLDEGDVDLDQAVLTVTHGKNGRARFVPLAACTAGRLAAYRAERIRILGPSPAAFFLAEDGRRPTDCCARYNFAQVCQRIGLRQQQRCNRHGRGPRIHDLRHTFAVRTIMDWYRRGLDPDREMLTLSTYLGHGKPEHTYWYLEAVPELLQLAAERAEHSLAREAL